MKIWFPIQIRFRDLDPLSHVNNTVYATYYEEARSAYFAHIPHWPLAGEHATEPPEKEEEHTARIQTTVVGRHYGILIKEITCIYHLPLIRTDRVEVGSAVVHVGRTSIVMEHQIRDIQNHERIFSAGRAVAVWCNYRTGRPVPVPASLRAAFEEIEGHGFPLET
ncbi:MAG TPA: thioesterase family protein [Ktedonobacteraceae bacterium]|nr:thioesterase family protein [Ktedonobacteraceae bacterium]